MNNNLQDAKLAFIISAMATALLMACPMAFKTISRTLFS